MQSMVKQIADRLLRKYSCSERDLYIALNGS